MLCRQTHLEQGCRQPPAPSGHRRICSSFGPVSIRFTQIVFKAFKAMFFTIIDNVVGMFLK
jgi:hypothetical protein